MRTIEDVYEEYKIMPTLREHMYRVAAVASLICDSIQNFEHKDEVVATCLVHDMGNIIKFDLAYFPEFLQPKGIRYWQQVKDDFVMKYGNDEHAATKEICHEIGLSDAVISNLDFIGFSKIGKIITNNFLIAKICCYADQRVGPYGVLSIEERLIDGRKRYEGRKDKVIVSESFEKLADALRTLERQVFEAASIRPEEITDEVVAARIGELKDATITA